jgi:hypothetical protein
VESADGWDDGSGWLAALAPLRTDVLAGDLRLFYLLWLTAVEAEAVRTDDPEPMLDDRRREAMPAVGELIHAGSLPCRAIPSTPFL